MKNPRNPLGRSLEELLGKREEIIWISLDNIKESKFQPRLEITPESLKELSESIKDKGIIEPLIVRPTGEGYEIIAGHRRFLAAKEAGLKEVPCIIKEISEEEAAELSLIENIQREDLNPVEEAYAIDKLIKKYNLTHEEVAKKINKSRVYVTNILRILKLPEYIKKAIRRGEISEGHARALLSLKDEKEISKFFNKIKEQKLSVRELEKSIKYRKKRESSPEEELLKKRWGVEVRVEKGKKGGKIIFLLKNKEELEFILEELLK